MNKLFALLLSISLAAVLTALPTAPAAAQQLEPLDRIVAVVNEDVILQSELSRAMTNIQAQYSGREAQLPPRDVLEQQVLERLILARLQVSRAKDNGIIITDEEIEDAIARVADQNKVTLDQLRVQLAQDNMSVDDLRNSIRDEIATQRLRQSFAQSRISVSEGEIDAAISAKAGGGAQYQLAHILVSVPEGSTAGQIDAAKNKIDGVKAQIDQGQIDFAAAAVRFSDSPNALEGGDLGWRDLSQIPPSFAQTINTMQPGQIIGPIRGPSGFQLLQLVATRDTSDAAAATITQYRARHILIRDADTSDTAAKAKIDTLRARIEGGAEFAKIAEENSQDEATAAKGGELGWFARDAYGVEFGAEVAALQDGQVSQPFKTQVGWEIVERQGTRQSQAGDEDQRQQVRESIGQRKLEEEWNRFLNEIRGEAYVDIRLPKPQTSAPAITPASGG